KVTITRGTESINLYGLWFNLRYYKENATMDEIKRAVEIAQAKDFVEQLPEGYHTVIRQGGRNLSGGQRQRITIARALVRNPKILILDDSFSALDYATDANLREALRKNCRNTTIIMVSQRANTIKNADKIIVLDDGRVAGIGRHEDLYKSCHVYKEICDSQIS
ncbi:MAG TPA: ABC transporter ATP-binding protein, partial [Mobilitalea sp.]|nr:ABC transporter ATP-binding protein [Mobilitalea sp.]